jgi:hypothetical protein
MIQPSRELINELIMNYLVVEGYKEGALKFAKEAGVKNRQSDMLEGGLIDDRIEVRRLIECGEIEGAIRKIDSISDEILKKDPELYFDLKR